MNIALLLVGLGLLVFPGAIGHRAGRFPADEWARVATLSLGLGALSVYAGLIMTTLPPVLHAVRLDGLLRICDPVVHRLMIGGTLVGWTAAATGIAVTIVGLRAFRRSLRAARVARIEPWLGTHSDEGEYELVVIPTPALVALGVPSSVPQIVVSQGLVDELDDTRLHAVVGHELAHLRLRHRRPLMVVAIVEHTLGYLPLVRRSTSAVRQSLEVWADDLAIRLAHATERSLHSALLAVAMNGPAGSDRQSVAAVVERAHRLIDPSPCLSATVRGLTYLPLGGLLCGAAVLAMSWILSSRQMLDLAAYC